MLAPIVPNTKNITIFSKGGTIKEFFQGGGLAPGAPCLLHPCTHGIGLFSPTLSELKI